MLPFAPVREIRPTFALSGNEFIAYVRRQDIISPLVGMVVGVVPLPRPLPNANYNFQIMSAEGLQITADDRACPSCSMALTLCKEMVWLNTKLYDHGSA